jgi:thymidylate synthase ThyX
MTISAKIIADSKVGSTRLTTMVLRYPRFIHAEFMTHRVFSRNASSSRAIPVQKMIEQVENDPAMPVWWGKNQAGMQAREALDPQTQEKALIYWHAQRYAAINHAHMLVSLGVHKQLVNRILEPWQHIEVVVTSTDWANFYALRDHPDAQPEIQALAQAMYAAHQSSTPVELKLGDWHLPFITPDDRARAESYVKERMFPVFRKDGGDVSPATQAPHLATIALNGIAARWGMVRTEDVLLAAISAARCARVSYLKHDKTAPSIEEDLDLFQRLLLSTPKHASPAEHQACNMAFPNRLDSNLRGVAQFRKMIEGECIREYKEFTS